MYRSIHVNIFLYNNRNTRDNNALCTCMSCEFVGLAADAILPLRQLSLSLFLCLSSFPSPFFSRHIGTLENFT